jgi:hypothetical protein
LRSDRPYFPGDREDVDQQLGISMQFWPRPKADRCDRVLW